MKTKLKINTHEVEVEYTYENRVIEVTQITVVQDTILELDDLSGKQKKQIYNHINKINYDKES